MRINNEKIENQIREKQRSVDYDVKEFTIEILVQKYLNGLEQESNDVFIPAYQREFVWDKKRQSKFIESVILGLPIPYIFSADNADGRLEIVDGSQRIRTLANYLSNNLKLIDLEILTELNGTLFLGLSLPRQKKIFNSTLRMIVLSDKSDEDARFMIFERINTGSDLLNDMEKRRGIFQGKFLNFLSECVAHPTFNKLTKFTQSSRKRREPEELILRFFAFSENYSTFKGNLNEFLNKYVTEKNKKFDKKAFMTDFNNTLKFAEKFLPDGFQKSKTYNSTPRVRFEALAVGINLALKEKSNLKPKSVKWVKESAFEKEITGSSTNTPDKVKSRIDFVKNNLLK